MTDTPDTEQAARQARREPLLVLLSRMQRGVLTAAERPLLRAAVETELTDGDQAHEKLDADKGWKRAAWLAQRNDEQALRLRKARQQRNEAREQLAAAEGRACLHATQLETLRARMSQALGRPPLSWSELYDLAARATATLTAVRAAVADAKSCGGEDAGCTVDHRDIITNLIDNGPALGDPQPANASASAAAEQPASALPLATCDRYGTLTAHPPHRFMRGRRTYQCPGLTVTDLRKQPAATTTFTLPEPARPTPVHVTPQQVADAVRSILREDHVQLRDLLR